MKHFLRPTLTAVALAVALGMTASVCAQTAKAGAAAPVDKAKASYVFGYYKMGESIPPIVRDELDPAAVARGVQAALSGQKSTVSEAEAKQQYEAFMTNVQAKYRAEMIKLAAKNKAEGEAFLAKNKKAPGVKTTASGLQYKVIAQGTGARPGPNDTVEINYTGSFLNGEVFDASAKHGPKPASIPLEGVIPGFREGLQLMQVGGHYKLFIPSSLAYGAEPQPPMPPNATLVFDVTLVKTGPTPAGAAPGAPGGQ
ncbi:MAG: FKBP-type peptidyl-prolyl cis-trans isomerase [Pseudomonadota bacterium]|jgi:FKBP-type peptidyl-prolyl cis-trans isomerase|nr:FKBP-type peptidyl-prolyl cis-trans isomerase [Xanthomonadaceae bacterium]MDE2248229.1 FKBP-type peptidyl-prolyl cis-trans isomerase [Xanthomonadaceae bacterium]MDE3209838.1 FKBP-type peptidyl-prolyl cis-trans isomerase [Pseudomonadota bacterium]